MKRKEAARTTKYINDVLVGEYGYDRDKIMNDSAFEIFDGKRPDIVISKVGYNYSKRDDISFVGGIYAIIEAKDAGIKDSNEWKDAMRQGNIKATNVGLHFYIVTNFEETRFYSLLDEELSYDGTLIIDMLPEDNLKLIEKRLSDRTVTKSNNIESPLLIKGNLNESKFSDYIKRLKKVYRITPSLSNDQDQINFTVGLITARFFMDNSEAYSWEKLYTLHISKRPIMFNNCINDAIEFYTLADFKEIMSFTRGVWSSLIKEKQNTSLSTVLQILNEMGALHGSSFDLFGSVYEILANKKTKKAFGQYFTKRQYTHVFAKLLLKDVDSQDISSIKVLDPFCGTGGFLTEAFNILKSKIIDSEIDEKKRLKYLSNNVINGFDVIPESVSRAKINMYLIGDGHSNIVERNTLEENIDLKNKYDYILTNPPYGNDTTVNPDTNTSNEGRMELASLYKIIQYLKPGGRSVAVIPDGIFEVPSLAKSREEILKWVNIEAIISLPKHAFAPYTGEKTYAIVFEKKDMIPTVMQKTPIWMYIIDNDGFSNNDKRFKTDRKLESGEWMHNEVQEWLDSDANIHPSLLEERWLKYEDVDKTEWISEKGLSEKRRKAKFVSIEEVITSKTFNLLPERYLRNNENIITLDDADKILDETIKGIKEWN